MKKFSKKCVNYLFAFIATFALVLAIAVGGATTVLAAGENIFPNGGFEDEGLGWAPNGGTPVLSADEAHTGGNHAKANQMPPSNAHITFAINLISFPPSFTLLSV